MWDSATVQYRQEQADQQAALVALRATMFQRQVESAERHNQERESS